MSKYNLSFYFSGIFQESHDILNIHRKLLNKGIINMEIYLNPISAVD